MDHKSFSWTKDFRYFMVLYDIGNRKYFYYSRVLFEENGRAK